MANLAEFQRETETSVNRDAPTKQLDGVVVVDALPDAPSVPIAFPVQKMVRQAGNLDHRRSGTKLTERRTDRTASFGAAPVSIAET